MIKLTYAQLNLCWPALQNLASQQPPAGAFRANLRKIIEQLSPEFAVYQKEFGALLLEFCHPVEGNPGNYQRPVSDDRNLLFTERVDELQKTEIEIRGKKIALEDLKKNGLKFSIADEIILSKWLIEVEEESEFPLEIEQLAESAK